MREVIDLSRAAARIMANTRHTPAFREFLRIFDSLKAGMDSEIKEAHRVWFSTAPDQRQFLPKDYGPCSVAFRELGDAIRGEDVRESCIKRLRFYVEHRRYPEPRIDATKAEGRE